MFFYYLFNHRFWFSGVHIATATQHWKLRLFDLKCLLFTWFYLWFSMFEIQTLSWKMPWTTTLTFGLTKRLITMINRTHYMFEDDRSDQIDFFNWCIYVWINLIHTTWVFVMYSITALNIWRDEYRWIFTFSEYISIEKRRNWRNLFVNSWFNMPLSWLSSFCFHFFFNAFLFRRVSDTLLCESFCYLDDILMMIFLLKLVNSF